MKFQSSLVNSCCVFFCVQYGLSPPSIITAPPTNSTVSNTFIFCHTFSQSLATTNITTHSTFCRVWNRCTRIHWLANHSRDWENVWQNMNVLLTVLLVGGAVIMLGGLNPYWTQKKTEQLFTREDWNFHSVIPQINNNNNKSTNQCNGSLTASPKKAKRDSKKIN